MSEEIPAGKRPRLDKTVGEKTLRGKKLVGKRPAGKIPSEEKSAGKRPVTV